jgi:hypothetical protein
MFEPAKLQMNCANASGASIRRDSRADSVVMPPAFRARADAASSSPGDALSPPSSRRCR